MTRETIVTCDRCGKRSVAKDWRESGGCQAVILIKGSQRAVVDLCEECQGFKSEDARSWVNVPEYEGFREIKTLKPL